jgi:hypothetical protein
MGSIGSIDRWVPVLSASSGKIIKCHRQWFATRNCTYDHQLCCFHTELTVDTPCQGSGGWGRVRGSLHAWVHVLWNQILFAVGINQLKIMNSFTDNFFKKGNSILWTLIFSYCVSRLAKIISLSASGFFYENSCFSLYIGKGGHRK